MVYRQKVEFLECFLAFAVSRPFEVKMEFQKGFLLYYVQVSSFQTRLENE
jgi:hypothetical protein